MNSGKLRIHWLVWQPTPYNDSLFRALAGDSSLDLLVHYRAPVVASHPWQSAVATGYPARFYRVVLGLDWKLIGLILRERGSLFVVGGWDHPTGQVLLVLARLLGRRYCVWSDTPDARGRRGGLLARFRSVWLRWIMRGAHRCMGTGLPAVQVLKQMGAPAEKVVNFPYWIDIDEYARERQASVRPRDLPMCFVSSGRILNRVKGHDIAVRALAQAATETGTPFRYVIAGAGPDEDSLRQLIDSLGLRDKVTLAGWLEPEPLRQLYRSSDVLIHPSPVHEPYGVVVIEAMAAELAVLASDQTGAALDRISQGNGLLHPAGNVEVLSSQIRSLLRNPESARSMGKAARATAELWPLERAVALIRQIAGPCVAR